MYVVVDIGRSSITIMDSLNIVATKRKIGNFVLKKLKIRKKSLIWIAYYLIEKNGW